MCVVDRARVSSSLFFVLLVSFSVPGYNGAKMSCDSDSSDDTSKFISSYNLPVAGHLLGQTKNFNCIYSYLISGLEPCPSWRLR